MCVLFILKIFGDRRREAGDGRKVFLDQLSLGWDEGLGATYAETA